MILKVFLEFWCFLAKAGNIIPAIATTNAIVSGLIVAQAIKIVMGKIDQCNAVFLILIYTILDFYSEVSY